MDFRAGQVGLHLERLMDRNPNNAPMSNLEFSLSSSLTASEQGTLSTLEELFNISALDPLLPTPLLAALSLCVLSVLAYYSLALTWELFWASRQSPLPLDLPTEVVLTAVKRAAHVTFSPSCKDSVLLLNCSSLK